MKFILLTGLLLTLNLTQSFAQTGDSLTCYTSTDLRRIADRVVRARECDTLLTLCELEITYADSQIVALQLTIEAHQKQIESYESIIVAKDADIAWLQEELFKDAKKRKWLKIGWASTSAILGTLLVIVALK